jgi:hypothetical protein
MAEAQEQLARSSYPDLMLEMTMIRMATLTPVLDADELMRAIGSAGGDSTSSESVETGSRPFTSSRTVDAQPAASRKASSVQQMVPESSVQPNDTFSSSPAESDPAPVRRIRFEGDVKADAPRRGAGPFASAPEPAAITSCGELPDLRDFIRSRRAALAGFMEQGASLRIEGELLMVSPRSDIYVRYLTDNRNAIADLASELYGRRIRVEIAANGATASKTEVQRRSVGATEPPSKSGLVPAPELERSFEGAANGSASPPIASPPAAGPSAPDSRQKLYADPVVRRIFEEFDARLVELKTASIRPNAPAPSLGKK